MIKLRYGYFLSGIITGFILLASFWSTIPDHRLHIVVCDVGQGDAIYVRFADGRDMLIDGGPSEKVLTCLGKHMPFWDRTLDMVVITHPQKDHIGGLPSVLSRYTVLNLIRTDVTEESDIVKAVDSLIADKRIPVRYVTKGERITVSDTVLSVSWPTISAIALFPHSSGGASQKLSQRNQSDQSSVLGSSTRDTNEACVVLSLHFGAFDALFMGDADEGVQSQFQAQGGGGEKPSGVWELIKVPHHGAKVAFSDTFLSSLSFIPCKTESKEKCTVGAISVGKNSYGHPNAALLEKLEAKGAAIKRTDQEGDIEVVTDGKTWEVKTGKTVSKSQ